MLMLNEAAFNGAEISSKEEQRSALEFYSWTYPNEVDGIKIRIHSIE